MRYSVIYLCFLVLFSGCASSIHTIKKENQKFTITANGNSAIVKMDHKSSFRGSGCLSEGIFYKDDALQLDYIKLKSQCTWTGLADGLYQDFLRKNIKGLKKTSSIKLDNGDIYKFNLGEKYFYLVSLYDAFSNIFVVDYTGKIVSELLAKELFISPNQQLLQQIQKEFLENYQFKGYFESTRGDDSDIIPEP